MILKNLDNVSCVLTRVSVGSKIHEEPLLTVSNFWKFVNSFRDRGDFGAANKELIFGGALWKTSEVM